MDATQNAVKSPSASPASGWIERFDAIYRDSGGNPAAIPWAHAKPSPSLVAWLNHSAASYVRCGARACVVGCGLGADAAELARRGFDVSAFDACEHAIEYASRQHRGVDVRWEVADLFDLPSSLARKFDLVAEVHTLQALPPEHREGLAKGIASLLHRRGIVVAVARGRSEEVALHDAPGPPFEFTPAELIDVFASAGLVPLEAMADTLDANDPPVRRLTGVFGASDAG